jgi:ferritin-like metal-binding protein YciE
MNLNSLHDVYVHELKDLYSAEKQITEALPKMVEAASDASLKAAFSQHLQQTHSHVERVRQILNNINVSPIDSTCKGMEGLLKEGEDIIKQSGHRAAKDAALISAAQRVEHYEMAAYGSAKTYADLLGYDEAASTLQKTLDEEGETNKKLTKLATGGFLSEGINEAARK